MLAGQCVTLHTEIDGKPQCRAYTLSSSPQDPFWQVTIKDVGLVSHHCTRVCRWGRDPGRRPLRRLPPDGAPASGRCCSAPAPASPHVGHAAGRARQAARGGYPPSTAPDPRGCDLRRRAGRAGRGPCRVRHALILEEALQSTLGRQAHAGDAEGIGAGSLEPPRLSVRTRALHGRGERDAGWLGLPPGNCTRSRFGLPAAVTSSAVPVDTGSDHSG